MSVTRLFDFAHHALYNSQKEDALVTKYNGVWTKLLQRICESRKQNFQRTVKIRELNREIKSG